MAIMVLPMVGTNSTDAGAHSDGGSRDHDSSDNDCGVGGDSDGDIDSDDDNGSDDNADDGYWLQANSCWRMQLRPRASARWRTCADGRMCWITSASLQLHSPTQR